MTERYTGKAVAFLTQHGKEALVAPLLEPALGCTIVRAEGYDTDLLGTFRARSSAWTVSCKLPAPKPASAWI